MGPLKRLILSIRSMPYAVSDNDMIVSFKSRGTFRSSNWRRVSLNQNCHSLTSACYRLSASIPLEIIATDERVLRIPSLNEIVT